MNFEIKDDQSLCDSAFERPAAALGSAFRNDRVTEVAKVLGGLTRAGIFDDLAIYAAARADRYARRLLWCDSSVCIAAMTWAPGQTSGLHDHAATWGADIVIAGLLRETQYALSGVTADERYEFVQTGETELGRGDIAIVSAPREYHSVCNSGATAAYTIHAYRHEIERCRIFTPLECGRWRQERVRLSYDAE